MKRLILLIGLAWCVASPALAQESCQDDETIQECWFHFFQRDAAAKEKKDLQEKETGLDISGADLGSTVKNFLPVLSFSGLAGDALKDNQNGTYTLDLTTFSPLPVSSQYDNLQLEVVFNSEPAVFDTLKASLPEATSEQRAEALKNGLSDLDDVSLAFSYNFVSKRLGRSFDLYRPRFASLFEAVIDAGEIDALDESLDDFVRPREFEFLRLLQQANLDTTSAENLRFDQIEDESIRLSLKKEVADAARAELAFEQRIQEQVDQSSLKSFAELINNQPQLHLTMDHHFRDDIVGPDETSAKLTFEAGFVNINAFEKRHGGDCDAGAMKNPNATEDEEAARAAAASLCLNAFRDYIANNKERLQQSERLAFSVGYSRTSEYAFSSPKDTVDLAIPKAEKLLLEAGYGRILSVRRDEPGSTRIDVTARLEIATNDEGGLLNDTRFVASLIITEKVGKVSIPFGLVYANKNEFLEGIDHQLSAHLGLKLNIFAK